MAVILNNAPYMGLPLSIKRGNPAPVDTTAVWYSLTELNEYAKTGATAYVGQVLTLVEGGKCEAYMISNEAGTLIKLASTTASGDLASDVATLQTKVEDLLAKVGAPAEGGTPASGLYQLIEEVRALANAKVASVTKGDASIEIGGSATEPTVKVALSAASDNALTLAEDGLKVVVPEVTHPVYSIKKDETSSDYAAVYHLQKDGADIDVPINIPKDMVIKSGTVVEIQAGQVPEDAPEGTVPGTYIRLVLSNSQDVIYINVGSLIEYVTGGSAETDAIQINVTKDTHKVSASVKDGSLTLAMLHADVKASLGKADSAVQEIASGSTNGTIAVDGADVAVTGLKSAAYVETIAFDAAGTGASAAGAVKTELLGTAEDISDKDTIKGAKKYAEEKASAAKTGAEATAKGYVDNLNYTDEAVAKKFVTSVSEAKGVISVARKELEASDIPDLGISKITGLQGALDAKQDTVVFDGEYSASNKAATVSTVNTAIDNLRGTADTATQNDKTIEGVRKYVEAKTSGIASDETVKALTNRVAANETAIAAINNTESGILAQAKAEINKLANGQVKTNTDAIAAINSAETGILKQAKDYADTKDTAIANAQKAGEDAAASVTALSAGQVTTNKNNIEALQTALGADDTTGLRKRVKANETAISTLVGATEGDNAKSARTIAQEEVAKIIAEAPESFDTLKEIADWISNHSSDVTTMDNAIKANTAAITVLNGADTVEGSVAKTVKDAVDPVSTKVAALEGKVTDEKIAQWDKAEANVLEKISVGGVELTVAEKASNIALAESLTYGATGLDINKVNVQTLFVAEADEFILNGGKA